MASPPVPTSIYSSTEEGNVSVYVILLSSTAHGRAVLGKATKVIFSLHVPDAGPLLQLHCEVASGRVCAAAHGLCLATASAGAVCGGRRAS